jgi:predicted nucleotidyltransferase component of viral defense system
MHEEALAIPTRKLFGKLSGCSWLSDFYLAGGTALALQFGHRTSVDLDFFAEKAFDEARIVEWLGKVGKVEILKKENASVIGILDDVKFSFLGYPYPLLKAPILFRGIRIASVEDIACMKLDALASRGTKRDFIDLYCIAKRLPLGGLMALFQEKYASVHYNLVHIKKSLVYFSDAEEEPLPDMRNPIRWKDVKEFFSKEALLL